MRTDQEWRVFFDDFKTKSLTDQLSDLQLIKQIVRDDPTNRYRVWYAIETIFNYRMNKLVDESNANNGGVMFWDENAFYFYFNQIFALKVVSSINQKWFFVFSRIRDPDGVFRGSTVGKVDESGYYGGEALLKACDLSEIHEKINDPMLDSLPKDLKDLIVLFCETQQDWQGPGIA